jgi:biopolymer transport protein TolR
LQINRFSPANYQRRVSGHLKLHLLLARLAQTQRSGVKNLEDHARSVATHGAVRVRATARRKGVSIMGMSVGGSKGQTVSDPNVVPLIDVLLVLIIIFMVITPQVPTGLPTSVPQAPPPQSNPAPADPHTIVVQVMPDGKLMINQEPSDWNVLGTRLANIFKQRADKIAFVEGAEEVSFADVARAIDIMRQAGIDHVGLITTVDKMRKEAS